VIVRNCPAAAVDTFRSVAASARTGDIAITALWAANNVTNSVRFTFR
jgi:hypothetical protein